METETENRHTLKEPQISVSGEYCSFKCRLDRDVPVFLVSVAVHILI
jgi:uncharacterized radical SAM superfamily protein